MNAANVRRDMNAMTELNDRNVQNVQSVQNVRAGLKVINAVTIAMKILNATHAPNVLRAREMTDHVARRAEKNFRRQFEFGIFYHGIRQIDRRDAFQDDRAIG